MNDLDVETENNQLVIRGKHIEEETAQEQERIFLHRGIAARQFQRNFILADGVEVTGASLNNGLLHIELQRLVPEAKIRKIEIADQPVQEKIPQAIDVEETSKSKKGK